MFFEQNWFKSIDLRDNLKQGFIILFIVYYDFTNYEMLIENNKSLLIQIVLANIDYLVFMEETLFESCGF